MHSGFTHIRIRSWVLALVVCTPALGQDSDEDGTRGTLCGGHGEACCYDWCCPCDDYFLGQCVCPELCNPHCDSGLSCIAGFCYPPPPCGGNGEVCCAPNCSCDNPWLQQYFGFCGPCGGQGQAYCINGTACQPGLVNIGGICSTAPCGADGEICCEPNCSCDNQWLQHYFGICGPCGGDGEPICISGSQCQPGLINIVGICGSSSACGCWCDPCGSACMPECNPFCPGFDIDGCAGVPDPDCEPPPYPTPAPVYVATGGSVAPDGTTASPYPSVQAGVCRAQAGQTVFLAPGEYRETFTWNTPVTLNASGGAATIGRTEGVNFITLKVMTYNTHLFGQTMSIPVPPPFPPVVFEDFADAQRAALLAARMQAENADVVGLTEVWDVDLANIIIAGAGYPYSYYSTALDDGIKLLNSGLLLLSRYPLSGATITYYDDMYAEDMFASKGYVSAAFQKSGMTFGVLVTHMQSLADTGAMAARRLQLMQLDAAADAMQSANPGAEVFVIGDLNVPGESCEYYDNLAPIMGRADAHRAAPCFTLPSATYNPAANDLIGVFTDDTDAERLDYILYNHNSGRVSAPLVAQIKMYQTSPPISEGGESASHLSDHFGLMAEFRVFP